MFISLTRCDNSGDHQSFGVPSMTQAQDRLTPAQLDEFALRSWESILLYMVASSGAQTPSRPVQYLLRSAGLMQQDSQYHGYTNQNDLSNMIITSKGFQFLLEDVSTQLWLLLHNYLVNLTEKGGQRANSTSSDIVEHMTFLFTLSSASLGQDYETSSLTPAQQDMLPFFSDLGLIYKRSARSPTFYPTRLITTLTSTGQLPFLQSTEDRNEEKGFVILETNYKVYAYTSEYRHEHWYCALTSCERQQATDRYSQSLCAYSFSLSQPSHWNYYSR